MIKQYKAIARIVESGKRIGFIVEIQTDNAKKKQLEMSNLKVIQMMNNGETFDIAYNNKGFYYKDKDKKISDLPVVYRKQRVTLTKPSKHKLIIEEYTGDALRNYVQNSGVCKLKHRDFVGAILEYDKCTSNRVLSISGLRGTGKTTGILQSISILDMYDDTVFISIDAMADIDCSDLRNLILSKYKNKKYIFIDEITRVKDIINNSGFLADSLCMMGKRVIISGTDSLGLIKAEGAGLYHRVININVTHISYKEAKRTMNQSLNDYIKFGGLYQSDAVKDIAGLRQYIETAVVDNIYNTLTKNRGTTGLLGLENIGSKEKLRTTIFKIIYAIIYMNTQKISKNTSVKYIIDLFDISKSKLYDVKTLNSLVCTQMSVAENIVCTQTEVQALLDAMESIGLLIKVENIFNTTEINYYITNPSIVNQLFKSIVSAIEQTNLDKKNNATMKGKRGLLFEAIVISHTKRVADKLGYNLYFYHDNNNKEVDLIVEKQTADEFEDVYLYYEIKMTNNSDIAVIKSKWINDSDIDNFASSRGIVVGKGIIYGGERKTFHGFEDKNMIPPKGITISQLEKQNNGVELISADDFLLNTLDKLSILENYNVD